MSRRVDGYIVGYGIYKSVTNGYGRERIIEETVEVPAKIGSDFGIRYVIKASVNRLVLLRFTWSRPKRGIADDTRDEFDFYTMIGPYSFGRLRNEHVWLNSKRDLVSGTWSVGVYAMAFCGLLNSQNCEKFDQDKLLFRKEFYLYGPVEE